MAARTALPSKEQQERTRAAIQTTQLVKRLQNYALGLPEPNAADDETAPAAMDSGRLKAIEILLRKTLPDLQSTEITADVVAHVVSSKPLSPEQWAAMHSAD